MQNSESEAKLTLPDLEGEAGALVRDDDDVDSNHDLSTLGSPRDDREPESPVPAAAPRAGDAVDEAAEAGAPIAIVGREADPRDKEDWGADFDLDDGAPAVSAPCPRPPH